MDNNSYQMPPMQPAQPVPQSAPRPVAPLPVKNENKIGLIKNIAIAVLAVIAVSFIALFFLKASDNNKLSNDFDAQVEASIAAMTDAELTKLENEFSEKYKQPFEKFIGPEDYGRLEFSYPKTWSVYVASDATSSRNFTAYFNPKQVDAISESRPYALKVEILNETYDTVNQKYKQNKELSGSAATIGGGAAVIYSGSLLNGEHSGKIAIFKIRDKTVVITTFDAAYENDFKSIIDSITFNS